jgi:hypothetical protein
MTDHDWDDPDDYGEHGLACFWFGISMMAIATVSYCFQALS